MNPVVCIAGPTASGKSAWAIEIAKAVGGEIINADAMQVYADLDVISARPSAAELTGARHHLFGHVDGMQRYSTGQWLEEATQTILDVLARGRVPILVGGTGLYFRALTQGLAQTPPVTKEAAEAYLEAHGISALRERAEALDADAAARVLGDDPQRLIRIVSVAEQTEKPLSVWQAETRPVVPNGYWVGAALLPDRSALYARINARFDKMVDSGGLDEVRALFSRGIASGLPVMKAIGAAQFGAYLAGEMELEAAIELAKRDSRRLAKRQYTWFRGQMKGRGWMPVVTQDDRRAFETRIERVRLTFTV